jgi:hypothetical protein
VASLNAQLKTSKNEFDKLKFARDAYTIGRHPSIKDGLGFKREAKNLPSHKAPIPAKKKGKAPMTKSSQKNHAFIYGDKRYSRNVHYDRSSNAYDSNAMFASSSSYVHGREMSKKMSFIMCLGEILLMFLGKLLMNLLQSIMLAMLPLQFVERIGR